MASSEWGCGGRRSTRSSAHLPIQFDPASLYTRSVEEVLANRVSGRKPTFLLSNRFLRRQDFRDKIYTRFGRDKKDGAAR